MKKSRKFLIFLLSAVMCSSIAVFAGCSDSNEQSGEGEQGEQIEEVTTATITYDTNGGSTVEQSTVDIGSTVTLPTPTKDGYNFAGWYYTYNSIEVEFTENIPVVADITLTAKWYKSYDLYLYSQSATIVKTGNSLYTNFHYDGSISDGYITIEKNNTVYTEDEALEAGWLSRSSISVYPSYIYSYLYFDVSGDYTIHAYANGDTASTCVTVTGESTSTSATFTGSAVSVDSITYLDSTYTNGSEVSIYGIYNYVYVYFNAPEYCQARITYTNGTKTYVSDNYNYDYSNGKYYVWLYEGALSEDYTYTVKLTSANYGSATATFTVKSASVTENALLTEAVDIEAYTGDSFSSRYYIACTNIGGVNYTITDSEGNAVEFEDSSSISANSYTTGSNNIYSIYYSGTIYTAGSYKLTVTPYDSNENAITALAQTINITVKQDTSFVYWSEDTTATGYNADYSNTFFTDTSSTYYYVANGELAKVILNGTNIPVGGSATLTISGVSVTAACSVASGKTHLTVTFAALSDDSAFGYGDSIRLYMVGTTADGNSTSDNWYGDGEWSIYVYSLAMIDSLSTMMSSYKYSLEKYFASYITADGDLYEVYTTLSSYASSSKSYKEIYETAYEIYEGMDDAIYNLTGTVYSSSVDYVGTWLTALDAKTSLCDYALEMYAYYNGCYYLVLEGDSVYDDDDLFWLGVSEYLLIQTSDKDICDFIYDMFIEYIESEADEFGELYTNLVKAHDSGTVAEYIAAINAVMLFDF